MKNKFAVLLFESLRLSLSDLMDVILGWWHRNSGGGMSKEMVWVLLITGCLAFWVGVIYLIARNAQWIG